MIPQTTFLGHACVLIEIGGLRILTDPVLFARVAFLGRVVSDLDPSMYEDIDLVLISHMHHDHCDLRSLRMLPNARLIVPERAAKYLGRHGFTDVIELPAGESLEIDGVTITATIAIHDGWRLPLGPHAESIGFVIASSDSAVYFAGDTDLFGGMRHLGKDYPGGIDVALLPVWGWGPNLGPGHLDPIRAVDAIQLIKPRYSIPIHWGTLFPYGLRKLRPSLGGLLQDPPRQFERVARARGIPGEVLVVEPGQTAVFAS